MTDIPDKNNLIPPLLHHPSQQEHWNMRIMQRSAFCGGFEGTFLKELYGNPYNVPIGFKEGYFSENWINLYFDSEKFGDHKFKQGNMLLDIGCGWGWFERWFADKGYQIWGVDISDVNVSILNQQFSKFNNIQFVNTTGDGYLKMFPDNMFDFVLSKAVMYHCTKEVVQNYVNEMYRILKPDGQFLWQLAKEGTYDCVNVYNDEELSILFNKFDLSNKLNQNDSGLFYHITGRKKLE
jgi:SAM-dependent methyltransferase